MGTDIHMYAETRDADGKWHKVGRIWSNPMYEKGDPYFGQERFTIPTDEPYDGRNYDLFAILADVRNGAGFAGVETGEGFIPISEPRGMPSDLSPELREAFDNDGVGDYDGDDYIWLGDHSFSYVTLRELQEYDWSQQVKQCGVIDWKNYLEHRKGTQPDGYCGGIWSQGAITINEDEAECGLPAGYPADKVNVRVWWKHSYRAAVGPYIFDHFLPRLEALGEPDDVRIVFGFDS